MIKKIKNILSSEITGHYCSSFVVNSIALLILSLIISSSLKTKSEIIIYSSTIEEDLDFDNSITIPETFTFDNEHSSISEEVIIEEESDSSISIDKIEAPSNVTIEPIEDIGSEFSSDLVGQTLSGMSANLGARFSSQASSGGALDRLTLEIMQSGESKNTNVIWLLDASISLSYQRQLIADRFEKILQELSIANTTYQINHGVYSFGRSFTKITKELTDNPNILKTAVQSIVLDESGIENTFSAIGEISKLEYVPDSRLIVVVFTDEVGDDVGLLDVVSNALCSKATMVYLVGNPAPFGKTTTQFRFVEFDPKYETNERWVEIQQGPETLHNMMLNMKCLPIDEETLDSGFGPYALSRLCLETGGIYFSVHPNRDNITNTKKTIDPLTSYISRFFDNEIMKKYKPDYRSSFAQNKEAETHISKRSLIKASLIPLVINEQQTLKFKAYDEGIFVNELNMAQRFSAKIEPKINEVYNILSLGESAHQSLEQRWKASYCLAMGRILATKCRIENYNLVLADAKRGLKKKDPKSNLWTLDYSNTLNETNSSIKKYHDNSLKYLKFVVENYPDTPWELIAQEELKYSMGYKWIEDYQEPPESKNGNGNGNPNMIDDIPRPKLVPKPQRKIDKI